MPQHDRFSWYWMVLYMGMAAVLVFMAVYPANPGKQVAYSEFVHDVENQQLQSVTVTKTQFLGILKSDNSDISTSRAPSVDESWLLNKLQCRALRSIVLISFLNRSRMAQGVWRSSHRSRFDESRDLDRQMQRFRENQKADDDGGGRK